MQQAAANRAYEQLHKDKPFHDGKFENWSETWSPETQYHYLDGVRIWVSQRDLTPDDDFLQQGTSPDFDAD